MDFVSNFEKSGNGENSDRMNNEGSVWHSLSSCGWWDRLDIVDLQIWFIIKGIKEMDSIIIKSNIYRFHFGG